MPLPRRKDKPVKDATVEADVDEIVEVQAQNFKAKDVVFYMDQQASPAEMSDSEYAKAREFLLHEANKAARATFEGDPGALYQDEPKGYIEVSHGKGCRDRINFELGREALGEPSELPIAQNALQNAIRDMARHLPAPNAEQRLVVNRALLSRLSIEMGKGPLPATFVPPDPFILGGIKTELAEQI